MFWFKYVQFFDVDKISFALISPDTLGSNIVKLAVLPTSMLSFLILKITFPLFKICIVFSIGKIELSRGKNAYKATLPSAAKLKSRFLISIFFGSCIEVTQSITPERTPLLKL